MISFKDIFGQDAAIESLLQAYRADRLPHGLIFAGPVGVGKGTTAHALAELLLCEKPHADSACGKCESCRAIAAGNHPDEHVIKKEMIRFHDKTGKSKATGMSIEVIRAELVALAGLKPNMGRGKVFVIEQAELMTSAAQNASLKTLEEPYGRTVIILLTDQPESLLATVRSRCRTIRFASLDEGVVQRELEKRGIDISMAKNAAKFSGGSLGLALRWIEDGVIEPARQLERQMGDLLAGQPAGDLREWFKAASESYAEKQLKRDELASKDQMTRDGLLLYLRLAAQQFRRRLAEATDPAQLERACAAIDAVAQAEKYLDANVNIPVIFQQLEIALVGQDGPD